MNLGLHPFLNLLKSFTASWKKASSFSYYPCSSYRAQSESHPRSKRIPITVSNFGVRQRRLDPGMDTSGWFFKVGNQKEFWKMVIIPFFKVEKVNIFGLCTRAWHKSWACQALLKTEIQIAINQSIFKLETSPSGFMKLSLYVENVVFTAKL